MEGLAVAEQSQALRPLLWKVDTESQRSHLAAGLPPREVNLGQTPVERAASKVVNPRPNLRHLYSEGVQTVGTYSLASWDHGASWNGSVSFF